MWVFHWYFTDSSSESGVEPRLLNVSEKALLESVLNSVHPDAFYEFIEVEIPGEASPGDPEWRELNAEDKLRNGDYVCMIYEGEPYWESVPPYMWGEKFVDSKYWGRRTRRPARVKKEGSEK